MSVSAAPCTPEARAPTSLNLFSSCLALGADEHLPAADDPSDQRFTHTCTPGAR